MIVSQAHIARTSTKLQNRKSENLLKIPRGRISFVAKTSGSNQDLNGGETTPFIKPDGNIT